MEQGRDKMGQKLDKNAIKMALKQNESGPKNEIEMFTYLIGFSKG